MPLREMRASREAPVHCSPLFSEFKAECETFSAQTGARSQEVSDFARVCP